MPVRVGHRGPSAGPKLGLDFNFGGDDETEFDSSQVAQGLQISEGSSTLASETQAEQERVSEEQVLSSVQEQVSSTGTSATSSDRATNRELSSEQIQALEETGRQELLGEQTRRQLEAILTQQAGVGSQQIDIGNLLRQRASGAESAVQRALLPSIAEARRQGEEELTRSTTGLRTAAGGRGGNSLVEQLKLRGRADLETRLAALQGGLSLEARRLGTEELTGASGVLGDTVLGDVGNIAEILKGSVATSGRTATGRTATSEQEAINELLNALTQTSADTTSQREEDTSRTQNIVDILNQVTGQTGTQNSVEALLQEGASRGTTTTDNGFNFGFSL